MTLQNTYFGMKRKGLRFLWVKGSKSIQRIGVYFEK